MSSSFLHVLQTLLQLLILSLQFLDVHVRWLRAVAFKAQFIHESLLCPLRCHVWSDVSALSCVKRTITKSKWIGPVNLPSKSTVTVYRIANSKSSAWFKTKNNLNKTNQIFTYAQERMLRCRRIATSMWGNGSVSLPWYWKQVQILRVLRHIRNAVVGWRQMALILSTNILQFYLQVIDNGLMSVKCTITIKTICNVIRCLKYLYATK